MLMAWCYRFVQDDAFISFRYARNLARGSGLVYNLGERVEGYTNFLWTICMAPAFWLGIDVVVWSETLSIASFLGVLLLTRRLARRWLGEAAASAVLALVAFNYSFCSYATGGLETMFGVFWILLSVDALAGERLVLAALGTTASFMTRMDSSLLLFPFWAAAVFPKGCRAFRIRPFAIGSAVILPLVGAWLVGRHAYYGAWLPNTFLIKGDVSLVRGLLYVGLFHVLYGFVLLAAFLFSPGFFSRIPKPALASLALWQGYLILVGGDFMEFRLFLPCFPFLAMAAVAALLPGGTGEVNSTRKAVYLAMLVLAFVGMPRFLPARLMQNIPDLKSYHRELMEFVGRFEQIKGSDMNDVRIAITSAGILPYYADLPTLDLLGLNDRDVAVDGLPVPPVHRWLGNRPGHCRIATWDMLTAKKVNLLINYAWATQGPPAISSVAELNAKWPFFHVEIPENVEVRLVAWPLPDNRFWPMVYVTPHPAVDAAILRLNAPVLTLR